MPAQVMQFVSWAELRPIIVAKRSTKRDIFYESIFEIAFVSVEIDDEE